MSWSEAVELGAGMFPVLAVGPNRTTVVWNSETDINGPLHVRSRESGEPWLPAQQIGFGADHAVASNSSNVTVVAWARPTASGTRVMVTRRESSGSWSAPQELRRLPPRRTIPGFGLHVTVGENGATAVWWEEMIEAEDPPDWNWSYVSYAAPSRPWERAHLLVDRQHAVPDTVATIDNMGGLDVAYATRTGIWMDRRDATQGWVGHEQVTLVRGGDPILMETPTGDTVVVAWPTDDGIAARRRTEGRWGSVTRWKARTADWTCEADMDDAGDVTFAWFSPDYGIHVREWPHGDGLEPVRTLLDGGPEAFRDTLQLAAGSSGDIVLGFVNWGGVTGSLHTLYKARDGTWGGVRVVGRRVSDPWFELVVRPSGTVEAVWEQNRPHDQGRMTIRYSTLAAPR